MEILGVGAPELLLIVVIIILVLGPKDMEKAGLTIGRWLNRLIRSDGWFLFQRTSRELRDLPTNLMREANQEMARTEEDIRKELDSQFLRSHASPGTSNRISPKEPVQTIQPPTVKESKSTFRHKPAQPARKKQSVAKRKPRNKIHA